MSPLRQVTDPGVRQWLARVGVLLVTLVLIGLVGRSLGEQSRTRATVEKALQIDCELDLRFANAPSLSRYPSAPLVELAAAARGSYIGKNCQHVINPRTGKTFGPPPPVFTARPSPSPSPAG